MHGHGFEVVLHAAQASQGSDSGAGYDDLERIWAPWQERLHLTCLNDIRGLENPTSEILASWLWGRLKPELPSLSRISVYETATAGCHYDGGHYRIWKEQRFESALRLSRAPGGHPRRRLHGHSYLLRLNLSAPLDEVRGWTLDFGDVKALFAPVYRRLDHRVLDDLPGLRSPDPAGLALWIREEAAALLPQLDRIDLEETAGSGATLSWGDPGPGPLP
jgi:6-pyruvoyltetrahydropterin/6-carboxytetrahydropterin synthase